MGKNFTNQQPAKEETLAGSPALPCSRFTAARVEELLQARDCLAEGEKISHKDACDLVNWYADELGRVTFQYQLRLMEISGAAMKAMSFPENAIAQTPPDSGTKDHE